MNYYSSCKWINTRVISHDLKHPIIDSFIFIQWNKCLTKTHIFKMDAGPRPRRALDVSSFLDSILRTLSNVKRKLNETDDEASVDYATSCTERYLINLRRIRPLISQTHLDEFEHLIQDVIVSILVSNSPNHHHKYISFLSWIV